MLKLLGGAVVVAVAGVAAGEAFACRAQPDPRVWGGPGWLILYKLSYRMEPRRFLRALDAFAASMPCGQCRDHYKMHTDTQVHRWRRAEALRGELPLPQLVYHLQSAVARSLNKRVYAGPMPEPSRRAFQEAWRRYQCYAALRPRELAALREML